MNHDPAWTITEDHFDPAKQHHTETIFTIGNGYLSTRGAFEEGYPREKRTTFMHGVFDDMPILFTELANIPDWMELDLLIEGERFKLDQGTLLAFERSLDLRTGLLARDLRWRSPQGRTVRLRFERFTSLADIHVALVRLRVTAEDFSGMVEVRAGINGEVENEGYKHWNWLSQAAKNGSLWLHSITRKSQVEVAIASRLSLTGPAVVEKDAWDVHNHPTLVRRCFLNQGQTAVVEKINVIYTSRDGATPLASANEHLATLPADAWDAVWKLHQPAWENEWQRCDIEIEGDPEAQIAVRFSIFQLLIAAPRTDEHVSIGAKTLSGFGYRGHAFWDTEIFMLPFFTYTQPAIARNLLSYRFHNLDGARRKAHRNGFEGAQFPWESAASGDEVTPSWVPHFAEPSGLVRIWTGDIEIHISAMVCFAVCQYWLATGDDDFMLQRGAEIFFEVARFWASRAEWNKEKERYEFRDVIGPDEYHDHVHNNAFTNAFARWTLQSAGRFYDWLEKNHPAVAQDYRDRLHLKDEERTRWKQVADLIYYAYDDQTGLVEQFEGYYQRREVNLEAMEPRTESIQVIFGIEGANLTQVLKQPDVLMLAYLLPDLFDERSLVANYNYYTPRTDHTYGSSLGPSIQAIMACRLGKQEDAYEHFLRAARADLRDVRGNAGDGIHGASAGGVWQAVVFGFGGLHITNSGWTIQPRLPHHWKRLKFHFTWRNRSYQIDLPDQGPFSSEQP